MKKIILAVLFVFLVLGNSFAVDKELCEKLSQLMKASYQVGYTGLIPCATFVAKSYKILRSTGVSTKATVETVSLIERVCNMGALDRLGNVPARSDFIRQLSIDICLEKN